jgi:hypothetical protein
MAHDWVEQRDAEGCDVRARLCSDIDPEIVGRHSSSFIVGVLRSEVLVRSGNDSGDGAGRRQHPDLLRFELLIPQRMSGSGADPMQAQITIVPDLRHGIGRAIERARDYSVRRARANRRDDVAMIIRDPTERGRERRRNAPLVAGDGIERHPRRDRFEILVGHLRGDR